MERIFLVDPAPLESALGGFARSLSAGFSGPMKQADAALARGLRQNFLRGGNGGGLERWEDPAPQTLRHRLVSKTPPALTDTGSLRDSLTEGGEFGVSQVGPHELFRGVDRIDAATHQAGRGGVPARPFTDPGAAAESEAVEFLVSDVERRALLCQRGTL
jgi:hypothetical protein